MCCCIYTALLHRQLGKAAEAAVLARQWSKAVQIVDMLDSSQALEHYQLLATHFASTRDFPLAEKYFLKADMAQVHTLHTHLQTLCTASAQVSSSIAQVSSSIAYDLHIHRRQWTCTFVLMTGGLPIMWPPAACLSRRSGSSTWHR